MNALDKVKQVQNGLTCCGLHHSCNGCPYKGTEGCCGRLERDALEVINALEEELKKRSSKSDEKKPEFIVLTTGIVKESGGVPVWYNTTLIAIRVDSIFMVSDYRWLCDSSYGSEVRCKTNIETVIFVRETVEEILGKITKGENQDECAG